ncbi:MAG: lipoprotein-releasing system transmembrane subunit, LolC/LolE family [Halieaceae bacterium]|nr:MAG: lipoprotein-releasing system transmembrane subunit, LolC/LolE family [Halieaceae bacterium]|tara:strand:+ start:159 stop:1394 length:1236 start_codon:yes stop_codon:yes gene_type:complete
MPLSWDLIIRFTLGGGQRRFTRFVALASLLGMLLGVAALITVLSVMNGFGGELHQRLLTVTPDMVLEPANPSEAALGDLLTAATEQPAVVAAAPFHQGTALLRHAGESRGAKIVGAPQSGLRDVLDLDSHITFGDLQALELEPFSVILGADLARLLRVRPGDNVDILLPRLTVSPMGVFPKSRSLRVVGTFAVGAPPDAQVAYVAEATARKLLGPAGTQGVQLRLSDRELVPQVSAAIRPLVGESTKIRDWRSSQGTLFAAIKMEKITVGILLTSVILVAAFNLIATLTMSVTEKRGDIAILQVLGLPAKKLLMLFLGHGLLLALLGISLGAVAGVALATTISDLSLWVEQAFGLVLFDPAVYYIGGLPSTLMWGDVFAVVTVAFVLSLLASVYPAWRAAKVPPAEVLNYV